MAAKKSMVANVTSWSTRLDFANGVATGQHESLCGFAETLDRRVYLRVDQQIPTKLERLRTKPRKQRRHGTSRYDRENATTHEK